jgi:hypothetical protein
VPTAAQSRIAGCVSLAWLLAGRDRRTCGRALRCKAHAQRPWFVARASGHVARRLQCCAVRQCIAGRGHGRRQLDLLRARSESVVEAERVARCSTEAAVAAAAALLAAHEQRLGRSVVLHCSLLVAAVGANALGTLLRRIGRGGGDVRHACFQGNRRRARGSAATGRRAAFAARACPASAGCSSSACARGCHAAAARNTRCTTRTRARVRARSAASAHRLRAGTRDGDCGPTRSGERRAGGADRRRARGIVSAARAGREHAAQREGPPTDRVPRPRDDSNHKYVLARRALRSRSTDRKVARARQRHTAMGRGGRSTRPWDTVRWMRQGP